MSVCLYFLLHLSCYTLKGLSFCKAMLYAGLLNGHRTYCGCCGVTVRGQRALRVMALSVGSHLRSSEENAPLTIVEVAVCTHYCAPEHLRRAGPAGRRSAFLTLSSTALGSRVSRYFLSGQGLHISYTNVKRHSKFLGDTTPCSSIGRHSWFVAGPRWCVSDAVGPHSPGLAISLPKCWLLCRAPSSTSSYFFSRTGSRMICAIVG